MKFLLAKLMVLFVLLWIPESYADSWKSPTTKAAISADGIFVARVPLPVNERIRESVGSGVSVELYRFSGDSYVLLHSFELNSHRMPMLVFVSNAGTIITIDQWGAMGYGNIISIYSADGDVIAEHALDDIFSSSEIKKMQVTTSSIWWRSGDTPILDEDEGFLFLHDTFGSIVAVDIQTGIVAMDPE